MEDNRKSKQNEILLSPTESEIDALAGFQKRQPKEEVKPKVEDEPVVVEAPEIGEPEEEVVRRPKKKITKAHKEEEPKEEELEQEAEQEEAEEDFALDEEKKAKQHKKGGVSKKDAHPPKKDTHTQKKETHAQKKGGAATQDNKKDDGSSPTSRSHAQKKGGAATQDNKKDDVSSPTSHSPKKTEKRKNKDAERLSVAAKDSQESYKSKEGSDGLGSNADGGNDKESGEGDEEREAEEEAEEGIGAEEWEDVVEVEEWEFDKEDMAKVDKEDGTEEVEVGKLSDEDLEEKIDEDKIAESQEEHYDSSEKESEKQTASDHSVDVDYYTEVVASPMDYDGAGSGHDYDAFGDDDYKDNYGDRYLEDEDGMLVSSSRSLSEAGYGASYSAVSDLDGLRKSIKSKRPAKSVKTIRVKTKLTDEDKQEEFEKERRRRSAKLRARANLKAFKGWDDTELGEHNMDHLPDFVERIPIHKAHWDQVEKRNTARRLENKGLPAGATNESAKDYLMRHKIKELFDMFMSGLLTKQPSNPVDFLHDMAREMNRQRKIENKADDRSEPCPCDSLPRSIPYNS